MRRTLACLLFAACTSPPAPVDTPDAAPPAAPDAGIPDGCSVTPTLVTYEQAANPPSGLDDTRCTLDAAGHCLSLELKGYLYVPPRGTGPFPILVDNHGSEQMPGEK